MGLSSLRLPLLFGQAGWGLPWVTGGALMILITLGMVIGLPVVLGIAADRRRRELEHLERMRAIEMGQPLPGKGDWMTLSRISAGIGIGLPIVIFGIAWEAAESTESAAPFIWISAGVVGVAAVICGTVLAVRLPSPSPAPNLAVDPRAKPLVHPDAFDFAEHHHL